MKNNTGLTKLPTVTVAVSAFNEEKNIELFLRSILIQKEEGFTLKKILVISDGSTDKTAKIARSLKSKKLETKEYYERVGKSSRLNEIYSALTSDILVQSDADVIFRSPVTMRNIIRPLIKNRLLGMCSGNPQPLKAHTFTEEAHSSMFKFLSSIQKKLRNGCNAYSPDGRILAYRKELVKQIKVPKNMIANDVYTFYCCLTLGYEFQYVQNAVVYFRSPQSLRDLINQNLRSASVPLRMEKYFSKSIIKDTYHIPFSVQMISKFRQVANDPVKSIYIFLINKYCHIKARSAEKKLTAKWDIARTTKTLFN